MKKRTEITIETERFLVVSQRSERTILWCHDCEKNVRMLTVHEAAAVACTTPLVISMFVEAGRLHFAVTPEGRHFICLNSLASEEAEDASERP
jgi:hypothetical protein